MMHAPAILRCFYHEAYKKKLEPGESWVCFPERLVKDYEFDLYFSAGRKIRVNDTWYEMEEGTLIVRRPGERVVGFGPFGCYMLTLDFSSTKNDVRYDRNETKELQPLCPDELLQVLPTCFKPRRLEECAHLMRQMALRAPLGIARDEESRQLVMEFLHLLAADAYHLSRQALPCPDRLLDLCNYMQHHFSKGLTLNRLAEYAGLDKSYLVRLFKKEMGVTPMTYLSRVRLENACLLLAETDEPIAAVAAHCGFQTATYFHVCFKKAFGKTPTEYRLMRQEKEEEKR